MGLGQEKSRQYDYLAEIPGRDLGVKTRILNRASAVFVPPPRTMIKMLAKRSVCG
jgi:hypothetical protein